MWRHGVSLVLILTSVWIGVPLLLVGLLIILGDADGGGWQAIASFGLSGVVLGVACVWFGSLLLLRGGRGNADE